MICQTCQDANNPNISFRVKIRRHMRCKGGTWCDCQHRVKPKTVVKVEQPYVGVVS